MTIADDDQYFGDEPLVEPVQIYGQTKLGKRLALWAERITKALATISSDHAHIHEGVAYTASTGFLTVAGGATGALTVAIPAGAYFHWKPANVSGSASGQVVLHTGAAVSGTATAITPRNRNRRSGTDSSIATAAARAAATITPSVELDHAVLPGGGSGGSRIGGQLSQDEEWVADDDTTITIAVTNTTAQAAVYAISAFWYEEEGA